MLVLLLISIQRDTGLDRELFITRIPCVRGPKPKYHIPNPALRVHLFRAIDADVPRVTRLTDCFWSSKTETSRKRRFLPHTPKVETIWSWILVGGWRNCCAIPANLETWKPGSLATWQPGTGVRLTSIVSMSVRRAAALSRACRRRLRRQRQRVTITDTDTEPCECE